MREELEVAPGGLHGLTDCPQKGLTGTRSARNNIDRQVLFTHDLLDDRFHRFIRNVRNFIALEDFDAVNSIF